MEVLLAACIGTTDCKTKYHWRSVNALLTLISRMWLGVWGCLFWTSRRLILRKWTVTYQCQYFMINSSISECDHKCETWNAEPEIGTNRSSQTRLNPRVDRYGSGFGSPQVSGSGFWSSLEPNRPVFAVLNRTAGGLPGPVANTTQEGIPAGLQSNWDLWWLVQEYHGSDCDKFENVASVPGNHSYYSSFNDC